MGEMIVYCVYASVQRGRSQIYLIYLIRPMVLARVRRPRSIPIWLSELISESEW